MNVEPCHRARVIRLNLLRTIQIAIKSILDKIRTFPQVVGDHTDEGFNLCNIIENIFYFGVIEKSASFLWLSDSNQHPWQCVLKCCQSKSSSGEPSLCQTVQSFKHLKSSHAKLRTWIRAALMAKCLHSGLLEMVRHQNIIKAYYTCECLFLSPEMAAIVNSVIDLGNVEFQFDLQSPELNYSGFIPVDYTPYLRPPSNEESERDAQIQHLENKLKLAASQQCSLEGRIQFLSRQLNQLASFRACAVDVVGRLEATCEEWKRYAQELQQDVSQRPSSPSNLPTPPSSFSDQDVTLLQHWKHLKTVSEEHLCRPPHYSPYQSGGNLDEDEEDEDFTIHPIHEDIHSERFQLISTEYHRILLIADRGLTAECEQRYTDAREAYEEAIERLQVIVGMNAAVAFPDDEPTRYRSKVQAYQQQLRILHSNAVDGRVRCKSKEAAQRTTPTSTTSEKHSPARHHDRNAEVLFNLPDGAQYCSLSATGQTDLPSYPSSLTIYRMLPSPDEDQRSSKQSSKLDTPPEYFLTVGDWATPLIPGVTPVLLSQNGLLQFSVDSSTTHSVGLILPSDMTEAQQQEFLALLTRLAVVRMEVAPLSQNATVTMAPPTPTEGQEESEEDKRKREAEEEAAAALSTGQKLATNMYAITGVAVSGMKVGAQKLGEYVRKGSVELCKHVPAASDPHQTVDPRVATAVRYARGGTKTLMTVSGKVVDLLAAGASKAGQYMKPHIQEQAVRHLPTSWTQPNGQGRLSRMDETLIVLEAGANCAVSVFDGLIHGARVVGSDLATGTSEVVTYKFGQNYGSLTHDACHTAGNVGMTMVNLRCFGPKGLLKVAARGFAMGVVQQHRDPNELCPNSSSSTSSSTSARVSQPLLVGHTGEHVGSVSSTIVVKK